MPRLIGIFGGTFDPVHNGHLLIAEAARQQLMLDMVLFIPNSRSPLKLSRSSASFDDRMAMLRLAILDHGGFEVSDIEGRRGGTSFTIDTLRELTQLYDGAELFLILGSDSLQEFHLWREHAQITQHARLAYIDRPDSGLVDRKLNAVRVAMEPASISSSAIRERVRLGLPIDDSVPSSVAEYIATRRLYGPPISRSRKPLD